MQIWKRSHRTVLFGLLASGLALGCGTNSTPPDAGDQDADAGGEIDPCVAALPHWQEVWKVQVEATGLEGLTPDINVVDVWGASKTDVYAVGFKGHILHNDGTGWTPMESGTEADLQGVWGYVLTDDAGKVTRTDVFAVGSGGTILRYDGKTWKLTRVILDPDPAKPDPQPVTQDFHDVWGIPAPGPAATQYPTVIAVGADGLIARLEGEIDEFREMRLREEYSYPCDGGSGGTCTRINYQRWISERLGGVFGTSANFFVAVGNNGAILEYDGSGWARQVITGFTTPLSGVWGPDAGEIFAVGLDGTILRRGGGWQILKDNPSLSIRIPPVYLRGVWGFSQSKCGDPVELPDGGPGEERQDTSWLILSGWSNTVFMAHDGIVCPFGDLPVTRFEGIWSQPPRSEAERTTDAGIDCDTVEVVIAGVKGTIVRLVDQNGR